MQKRAIRLTLFALLLLTGIIASYVIWDVQQRLDILFDSGGDFEARLDRVTAAVAALGAAQQAYVAPGQTDDPWFDRATALVGELTAESAALGRHSHSAGAATRLRTFVDGLEVLVRADTRARENVRLGQELMAADLIYSEARDAMSGMSVTLDGLRSAEAVARRTERNALITEGAAVAGGTAALWVVGLILLTRLPRREAPLRAAPSSVTPIDTIAPAPVLAGPAAAATAGPAIRLNEAAEVCTAISRITDARALPDVLARAAEVIDAAGIILWLSAGEELFAVTAHGYSTKMLERLGPIVRSADNATAAAWRLGEIRIVAGDIMSNGAIVAPMFGPQSCIGALAAEVRHGRETDAATQAVTAIIAAQLASIVAAWPAASAADAPSENPTAANA
jgi:hypothetical protein